MIKLLIKIIENSPCSLIKLTRTDDWAEFNKTLSVGTNSAAGGSRELALAGRPLRAKFA